MAFKSHHNIEKLLEHWTDFIHFRRNRRSACEPRNVNTLSRILSRKIFLKCKSSMVTYARIKNVLTYISGSKSQNKMKMYTIFSLPSFYLTLRRVFFNALTVTIAWKWVKMCNPAFFFSNYAQFNDWDELKHAPS